MSKRPVSHRAKTVWRQLIEFYGRKFAQEFGELPPDCWASLIDRTPPARMDKGLINLRRKVPTYLPTFSEFESAIPVAAFDSGTRPIPELLIEAAMKRVNPCRHQLTMSWPIQQRTVNDDSRSGGVEYMAVVIPTCPDAQCGRNGVRVTTRELR